MVALVYWEWTHPELSTIPPIDVHIYTHIYIPAKYDKWKATCIPGGIAESSTTISDLGYAEVVVSLHIHWVDLCVGLDKSSWIIRNNE